MDLKNKLGVGILVFIFCSTIALIMECVFIVHNVDILSEEQLVMHAISHLWWVVVGTMVEDVVWGIYLITEKDDDKN